MVWSSESHTATSTLTRGSMLDLLQSTLSIGASSPIDELRLMQLSQRDQTEAVASHTQKGIEFLERFGNFAKERAAIEEEYAAKLRALARKSIGKKKEDDDAKAFSYMRSFSALLKEVESLAAQHEVVAERIRKDVVPFISNKAGSHRQARKQYLGDLQQIHANLNAVIEHMYKQQKNYGKTFKEAEAAYLKYYKAEKNMEISRLDLEKAKNNATLRSKVSEEAKQCYAAALGAANENQQKHYTQLLPVVLDRLKGLDGERILDTQTAMVMTIQAETEVMPILARCHEDMRAAAALIDPNTDTALVLDSFRSGYVHPQPFPFEDLGQPESILNAGPNGEPADTLKRGILGSGGKKESKSVSRKQSMHQKLFGGGDKHKNDSDYGSLPPQQRVRRLQAKINELQASLDKTTQARDGLQKMQSVYKENPKMGNAADCDGQISQYGKEMESLTQQVGKLKVLLDSAQAEMQYPAAGADTPPSTRSDSGFGHTPARPQPPNSQNSQRTSYSGDSISSEGSRANGSAPTCRDEVYEECAMPALGTGIARFDYDGGPEGTMQMKEAEEFLLVEKDEGDGWTRVRRLDSQLEGFVPTSYLNCRWYPGDDS